MDTDERLNEERIAALEQRLTALESRAEGCITQDEYRARLASLRAPGVEIPSEPVDVAEMQAQIHEADMDRIAASERLNAANAALATARRERDEAVAIVRDWLVWRSVHHVSDVHFPDLASVLSRARALVAGQATPDARDAEIAGWREASKAMTGEIATLRAQLDTALARVAELEAREVAANHRALGLQYELDTVVAALQERDRESRWIIEHIPMMQGSPTFEARVAEYLSATPPADPARGLIERLVAAYDGCSRRGTIEECNAQERAVYDAIRDLRARIAELEARDREGRWIVQESRNACDTEPCAYGKQHRHDDYDCRRTAYLSGAAPPDPARGLIERAVPVCEGAAECQHDGPGLCRGCGLAMKAVAADLRAYLAALEGR
jgi:BMFP domain-containing protein YqiC